MVDMTRAETVSGASMTRCQRCGEWHGFGLLCARKSPDECVPAPHMAEGAVQCRRCGEWHEPDVRCPDLERAGALEHELKRTYAELERAIEGRESMLAELETHRRLLKEERDELARVRGQRDELRRGKGAVERMEDAALREDVRTLVAAVNVLSAHIIGR